MIRDSRKFSVEEAHRRQRAGVALIDVREPG
jgi:hypothetical protein